MNEIFNEQAIFNQEHEKRIFEQSKNTARCIEHI